jgi:hypothetical protein
VAELDLGEGSPFTLVGRAYVDGNLGRRPLTTLGIRRWRWGRLALDGRELIYYQLEPREPEGVPRTLVVEVAGDGQAGVVDAELDWQRPATSKYGPRFHRRVRIVGEDIDVEVRQRALVDDGPFYLRFLTTAHAGDGELIGHGTSELVLPERIDVPWQRPFVRMRRHHRSQRNSMWLPLFSGARRDRVSRLLRHWQRPTVVEARS